LLMRIIYNVLRDREAYNELGQEYLGSRERSVDYWVRKIKEMGFEVEVKELQSA